MGDVSPVAQRDRIAVLDVLRGFALWGVLIGNTIWFYSARAYAPQPVHSSLDFPAVWFVDLFVAGKAMTLLTFMFGLGFALQLVRGDGRPAVRRTFVRRLVAMFALGWCHVAFLWWGDITWTYAMTGFSLLAFMRTSDRRLLVWFACLTFIPTLVVAIPSVDARFWTLLPDRNAYNAAFVETTREGSFFAVIAIHAQQAIVHSTPGFLIYWPWQIGRFLLGLIAGRRGLFDDNGAGHILIWKRVLVVGGIVAAANVTKRVLEYLFMRDYELTTVGHLAFAAINELGTLAMAAVYVSSTVLLFQRPRWRRVLLLLAPAGRMPLTTYMMQSVIMTTMFYGRGFDLVGKLSFAGCLGLALAVFPVQVAMAHLWLRYFRFGPVEWLWRTLAYGRRQPMRA